MKRCLILVEGPTEERFVKDVLLPEFLPRGLHLSPVILATKVVKSGGKFTGGVTSYTKIRRDLIKLLGDSGSWVTTMIDYYGLPEDTPGMANRPPAAAIHRVKHVEQSVLWDVGSPGNFRPFLALHEFEALLFTDTEITASVIPSREKAQELLAASEGRPPEDINENPATAPSKRLLQVFPTFKKTLHGPTAAKRIGLEAIRARCPHFNEWICWMEGLTG